MNSDFLPFYDQKKKDYYEGLNPYLLKKINGHWKTVLDVGCGTGNLGEALQDQGITVYGIEAFPDAAQQAENKLAHVLCGDIERLALPYEPEQFDCILFGDVLEHLVNPWSVLENLRPHLKKDGTVLACVPNVGHISVVLELLAGKWTYTKAGLLDQTHLRFFTLHELYALFTESGYTIKSIETIRVNHPSYHNAVEALHRVCVQLGIRQDFLTEASAYQYVIEAGRKGE
ncbi:class I SAM-dependent methyltransferase [Bacillus atrophaeus]|uniref:class I SAM-dependent methyltransferase n=1 Tax=Bacillus atrophaeus TaxID=1452 RepID=UPI00227EB08E|nr:class I SAM-dependent methyltransferase [Bacillus atrophaeus]MCY8908580.1 class I SAM-dependent methyltransferase [Bacillus atrophaeus]MEC0836773.1 class I SAM-dependent methyltransferase [Bacillus atrophaeus]MEC0844592.1 class I SAM-dependent methyltransferase [Bacillus atrophaeus]MEC0849066.1 class I SAM-dependent methyltransferase [Bacillus atrophaeus]MEC0863892.1 class I SAM-dependent methyltransferase [Bacillus atrophaeus]